MFIVRCKVSVKNTTFTKIKFTISQGVGMSSLTRKLRDLKDYKTTIGPEIKDEIILEYAPLIKYIAQKIASRLPSNIELDDLISCGVIGLMDAIDKYDPTRDNKFKTYAEFRIRGSILD